MEMKIKELILEGFYCDAEKVLLELNQNEQKDLIMSLAYDTESISVYSFLRYMSEKNRTQFWLELIIDVMINPLCFIEGAYSTALFHTRELLKMNSSVTNMERILFFYNIPEKLVGHTEAKLVAKEIISVEPNNVVALEILK
mgnify:FL=1